MHLTAYEQWRLGWLKPPQIESINVTKEINIAPIYSSSGKTLQIVFPPNSPIDGLPCSKTCDQIKNKDQWPIALEYRKSNAFDLVLSQAFADSNYSEIIAYKINPQTLALENFTLQKEKIALHC